ncbi:MAG: 50S ribosomal protein L4 [Elusimicrobiota bacterium]
MGIPLFSAVGENVGTASLPPVFEGKANKKLLYEVVKSYLARQRQGTASTKRRDEVSGGGKKPWRQKEAGRARAGSIRSPLWRHGGIVFGPKPRSYYVDIPKKKKKMALLSALMSKTKDMFVIQDIIITEAKTKKAAQLLKKIGLSGDKLFIVVDKMDKNIVRVFNNIDGVTLFTAADLNAYHILSSRKILLTQKALDVVIEKFKDINVKGEESK